MKRWLHALRRAHVRRFPGQGLRLQVLRRSVQFAVLLLLLVIPSLSLYDHLRNQHDESTIASRFDTRTIEHWVSDLDDPSRVTQVVRGSVWTLKAGDVVISDPLAVVDFVGASRTFWDAFALTALLPVLLSLLLGRIFCGWICPADLLFEAGSLVRRWAGIERDVPFSRRLKYFVLVLGLGFTSVMGSQFLGEIYPPRLLSGEIYLWSTFGALGAGAWFLLLLTSFEVFVSHRFWCRYVCPGGALYSLLGRFRLLRLMVKRSACTDCTKCLPVCEFGLDPSSGAFGQECNNCGLCVRACAPKALVWQVGLPKRGGLDVLP